MTELLSNTLISCLLKVRIYILRMHYNYLIVWDAQFIVQSSLSRFAYAKIVQFSAFLFDIVQRMATTSVCIAIGKCYLHQENEYEKHKVESKSWTMKHYILVVFRFRFSALNIHLVRCSALYQHIAFRIEQKHTECPMQFNPSIVIDSMAIALRCQSNGLVIFIY